MLEFLRPNFDQLGNVIELLNDDNEPVSSVTLINWDIKIIQGVVVHRGMIHVWWQDSGWHALER